MLTARNKGSDQRGFSLLEVLVAVVLLFAVIASVATIFQTSLRTSGSAADRLELLEVVPAARARISEIVAAGHNAPPLNGAIELRDVTVQWSAKLLSEGQLLTSHSDVISTMRVSGASEDRAFYLWEVDMSVSSGSKTVSFSFSEITWDQR